MDSPCESNKLSNKVIRWIISKLPNTMKRQFFIASLTSILLNKKIEKDLIKKIDNLLSLTTTGYSSLEMPIALTNVIWCNKETIHDELVELQNSLQEKTININLIKDIIRKIPSWFKYNNEDKMFEDISCLLVELKHVS